MSREEQRREAKNQSILKKHEWREELESLADYAAGKNESRIFHPINLEFSKQITHHFMTKADIWKLLTKIERELPFTPSEAEAMGRLKKGFQMIADYFVGTEVPDIIDEVTEIEEEHEVVFLSYSTPKPKRRGHYEMEEAPLLAGVGICSLWPEDSLMHCRYLISREEHRKEGLGVYLVNLMKERALSQGFKVMTTEALIETNSFWRKQCGFKHIFQMEMRLALAAIREQPRIGETEILVFHLEEEASAIPGVKLRYVKPITLMRAEKMIEDLREPPLDIQL